MTEGSPIETMPGARAFLATVRPQIYATGAPDRVLDPLIEPLWVGIRALGAADAAGAIIVDDEGEAVVNIETIVEALDAAARASGLVVDGFLTKQTIQTG